MADWKQITARIRRARTGKDPAGQLTNLFSKTRDAMVAFELARYFETSGNTADAGRWYLTAAERFRRSDWKAKAQESATRLGATEPAEIPQPASREKPKEHVATETGAETDSQENEHSPSVIEESREPAEVAVPEDRAPHRPAEDNRQHRRGHRAGRDKHTSRRDSQRATSRGTNSAGSSAVRHRSEETVARSSDAATENPAETPAPPSLRGRYGDPGLSSRLSQLEMNFRRLLASTPSSLEEADKAPAGPGVWVLTDSDLTTYYYVEPCETLRVAIPNLLRGGSSRKGESIRPRLAEHLGIPESRVTKYLGEHCVVRWLQMDEDSSYFAHFLIAVLRPALNE
jgi:hypothetical protein